jgi:hypothetical protein
MSAAGNAGPRSVLVVDVANVMGSRPDGWWRDRAGAASRLLATLVPLLGTEVSVPAPARRPPDRGAAAAVAADAAVDAAGDSEPDDDHNGESLTLFRIIAVVEGQARSVTPPPEIDVRAAPADGDSTIVAAAQGVLAGGHTPLVVTADRGLRARLPAGSRCAGPRWLLDLL